MTQLSSIDLTSFLIIKIFGSGGVKLDLANELYCAEWRENKAQTWCLSATVGVKEEKLKLLAEHYKNKCKRCDQIQHVELLDLKLGETQPKRKVKYEEVCQKDWKF